MFFNSIYYLYMYGSKRSIKYIKTTRHTLTHYIKSGKLKVIR